MCEDRAHSGGKFADGQKSIIVFAIVSWLDLSLPISGKLKRSSKNQFSHKFSKWNEFVTSLSVQI
jgi:hypothetical protein